MSEIPNVIKEENINQLRELSGGTDDLLVELVEKFIENGKRYISDIEKAYAGSDWDKIRFAVHTMKGSALSLGLSPMGEYLSDLNQKAKENKFDEFQTAVTNLNNMLNDVQAYFDSIS
ncbi:MAG: Hpt domain-containing protein [Spirochaetia bacterium]|nr:Hpt domain-containing protein [Spirochaetia bacterium]